MNKSIGNTVLLLLLVLCCSFSVYAQDDEGYEDDELMEEGFNIPDQGFNLKQRLFIGGNIGLLGFSSQQIGINLSPFIGVRVVDQIHLGTGFNYSFNSIKNRVTGSTETFTVTGVKVFSKFLFLNFETLMNGTQREPGDPLGGLYGLTEFEQNWGRYSQDGLVGKGRLPASFYLGVGYQANFHRNFAYFMEATYDLLESNPNVFPVGIRAGLYYGF